MLSERVLGIIHQLTNYGAGEAPMVEALLVGTIWCAVNFGLRRLCELHLSL